MSILNHPLKAFPVWALFGLAAAIGLFASLVRPTNLYADWCIIREGLAQGTSLYSPHIALLLPHLLLSCEAGAALNGILFIWVPLWLVRHFDGDLGSALLVLGNPATIFGVLLSQLDWLPALVWLLPAPLAGIAFAAKPQTVLGCLLTWLEKRAWSNFLSAGAAGALGVAIGGAWWHNIGALDAGAAVWNIAPFPMGVPFGLWLLWRAWQERHLPVEKAAILAPLISPYFALYSLTPVLAVVAAKQRRWAIWLVLGLFYLTLFIARRDAVILR